MLLVYFLHSIGVPIPHRHKVFSDESPDEDSSNYFAFRRGLVVFFIKHHAGWENLFFRRVPAMLGKIHDAYAGDSSGKVVYS